MNNSKYKEKKERASPLNLENFGEEKRKYSKKRAQYKLASALLDFIPGKGDKRVLDLGCGMGEFSDILKERDFEVICLDGAERCYKYVLAKGFESYKINLEKEKLPFIDNSFDLVVSLEVIEHLWNTDDYLKEINRILKPGGYILLSTHNYNNFIYRIQHLIGRFEGFTYLSRHKKYYTPKSFKKEIERYFDINKILGRVVFPKVHFNNKRLINLLSLNIGILAKKKNSL